MRKVDVGLLDKYDCKVEERLYYKNNKPIVSKIVRFEGVEKAVECKEGILRHYNKDQSADQTPNPTNPTITI